MYTIDASGTFPIGDLKEKKNEEEKHEGEKKIKEKNMVEEPVTTWAGLRILLCCLQQSSTIFSRTTASSSSFDQDSSVEPNGGRSFTAA
jgi:hypothetical protein